MEPSNYRKTARIISTACGFLFIAFAMCYLYFFQAQQLAVVQHVLSRGVTTYSALWGTIIITFLLVCLQMAFKRIKRFPLHLTAFSYFPSCCLLGLLTSIIPRDGEGVTVSVGWAGIVFLVVVCMALVLAWQVPELNMKRHTFSGIMWPNFFVLFILFIMTVSIANTNDVWHYRLKMEKEIEEGNYGRALEVGEQALQTERSMCAMRAYALSKEGKLADALFKYPQPYGSYGLLPEAADTIYAGSWQDSLFIYLGGKPGQRIKLNRQFFEVLSTRSGATTAVPDYLLCACLLDKRLDQFVRLLPQYYAISSELPIVYKEALAMYNRMHINPLVAFHDPATEENYSDFLQLSSHHANELERVNFCRRMYGHTYWWYYYFQEIEQR